jgi:transposase InsO family protein
MPWKDQTIMDQRYRFILDYQSQEYSLSELCRSYGISRTTAYKWLQRHQLEGAEGLKDRSHAPHNLSWVTPPEHEALILAARAGHPRWGPLKLKAWLEARHPGECLPAPSTIGEILSRHGLCVPRKRLHHAAATSPSPLAGADTPNHTWCIDFKGEFHTADGERCEPLTVSDGFSRYLLCCQLLPANDTAAVRARLEALFRQYGLPRVMRSDNGPPFASTGLGGLSELSVWWIRLGILPERIHPASPQENGRHERMHLTLLQETASPPAANRRAQQRRFDDWRREFNEERPHQALGMRTPASLYHPSERSFPSRLSAVEYPEEWMTRSVRGSGQIKWGGHDVRVTRALCGELVGLQGVRDGLWRVYFVDMALGWFDERRLRITAKRPGKRQV